MCRICGGKKIVYGLGYIPKDCVCTITTEDERKGPSFEIVEKPQKTRKKRTLVGKDTNGIPHSMDKQPDLRPREDA